MLQRLRDLITRDVVLATQVALGRVQDRDRLAAIRRFDHWVFPLPGNEHMVNSSEADIPRGFLP
jgi:hypothetical protein